MKITITQEVVEKVATKQNLTKFEIKLTSSLLHVQAADKKTYYCEYQQCEWLKMEPDSMISYFVYPCFGV